LRSTAEAHRRVMVLVMGCHAGWIATHAGVAALDLASAGRWGMMAPLRGAEGRGRDHAHRQGDQPDQDRP
jgi:hypothetical protein